ncbi:MAG: MarR family winged helix-turn-helix transcriptional regulator [Candidatus Saccharimonadales bacterium]
MDPINTLGYLFHHTSTIMYRQSDQILQERLGIGMSQFKLLMMLQNRPGVQQKVLAECLGQTEASISRQIKLLLEKGMLAVKINAENRREHLTVPTAKGVKIGEAAKDILAEHNKPAFEQLSDKQRDQLTAMLRTIHAHYCQPDKPYACDKPFDI